MSRARFSIRDWAAWAPGISGPQSWQHWAQGAAVPGAAEPDVRFVPALQRRRLNGLARMLFAVCGAALGEVAEVPVVYHSRHGDLRRTLELLSGIARREPLSPNEFSLSVHNAGPGQWSIFRNNPARVEAIATGAGGLEHAMVLASGILAEGAASVLVVTADVAGPEPFAPWTRDAPYPHALALYLQAGSDLSLELAGGAGEQESAEPSSLAFLRHYLARDPAWIYADGLRRWQWRASAFRDPVAAGA